MLPAAPPSPDYVPGPEEPQTPPAPQDEDEHEPMFIQPHDPDFPLPPVVSPTAESPEYVVEWDPEEYEDDETKDGPVDYPIDEGDDGDDDDDDSSGDDVDDEDEDEEDEEEEEHLAPADSAIVMPTVELASPPEETELVIPPPSTDTTTTGARTMPTLPPSPFASLSPPSARDCLAKRTTPAACPSPPPAPSSLLPSSRFLTQIQTLRLASTQALIDAVTAAIPSPPLPPPPYIPPPVDRRDDIPEIEIPPRKRLCLSTLGFRYEVGESSTARPTGGREIDYGFVSTLDAKARRRGIGEVGVTELVELHEHDTHDLYALLEDAQDSRTRISQRVAVDSQRVDLLMEDRIAHQDIIQIVEEKAYAAREAELLALREQSRRARQPGGDARVPNQQDTPRDADSHI
uniref:Uncharacterized protein n=1 Tax=Tanacetum cinerariifolium TaxID=118510 RepID=A0A699H1A6_TANCI|nr:hypothetical protein [Tanacetum cinerariifolium]